VSDKVHEEAYELARDCAARWLGNASRAGVDVAQISKPGPADPVPFIAEAIAAAITGRDPVWDAVAPEPAAEPPVPVLADS
jgi:hypothetical protein